MCWVLQHLTVNFSLLLSCSVADFGEFEIHLQSATFSDKSFEM